jgi:hypothetical protein
LKLLPGERVMNLAAGYQPQSAATPSLRKLAAALLLNNAALMAPAVLAVIASATATPARAAIPVLNVGDPIFNPATGATETVTQILSPASVATSGGFAVITAQTVNDQFVGSDGATYRVTAVTTQDFGGTPRVVSLTLLNVTASTSQTQSVATSFTPGGDAVGSDPIGFPPACLPASTSPASAAMAAPAAIPI